MPRARRLVQFILLLVVAAAGSSACDNANPAGPSAAAGATITGSLVTDRAMAGVTVAVSGTNLGASVGPTQQFTIQEVPAGTVRLLFRGPGLNGAIDLTGVQPADTIELVVRVNGSTVALDSDQRRRDDDDDDDVKFDGVLTSRTGIPPILVLTVGGRTVNTNTETIVRRDGRLLTLDALVVGQRLEVEGTREALGSVLAERIEIQDRDSGDPCGLGGANVNRDLDVVGDCTITGHVNGNIKISNGTLTVDGSVNGNIEQAGFGGVTVAVGGFVDGNIKEMGAGAVTVRGTVNGKIEEEDAGDVLISAAGHAKGDVIEKGLGDVEVNGSVDGNVEESEDGSVLGNGVVNGNVKESGPGFIAPGLTVKGKRESNG